MLVPQVVSVAHYGGPRYCKGAQGPGCNRMSGTTMKPPDPKKPFDGTWHTYAVEWEKTQLRWSVHCEGTQACVPTLHNIACRSTHSKVSVGMLLGHSHYAFVVFLLCKVLGWQHGALLQIK